jgi:arginine deiminase
MAVHSEIDHLRKVIIHEPDFGIEKVTPEIAEELLYDDIVYLPRMVEEHRIFTDSLKVVLGEENVLDFEDLLIEVLAFESVKSALLEDLQLLEGISDPFIDYLNTLPRAVLGKSLISGIQSVDKSEKLFPLPNLIFTRDIAVAINEYLVICSAKTKARKRESLLSSYVFRFHELFEEKAKQGKVIDLYQAFKTGGQDLSLEGGDMMIINRDHVFIGCSERTDAAAIQYLASILLGKDIVKFVTQIDIPAKRYCMHLDTIFTMIDHNACIGFQPLMFVANKEVVIRQYSGDLTTVRKFDSVKSLILSIYPEMKCLPCGGGQTPYQEREQWTDGSNLVTLKAGVFYGYDRNYHTSGMLKELGYHVKSASLLTDRLQDDSDKFATIDKMLITLPSGELSRARGGSHCMTLPIVRG